MGLYMTQFAYTPEAWAALVKNPQDRAQGIATLAQRHGGRMLSFYYAFGEHDGVVIFEAPDDVTASAIVLGALSPGHLKAVKTTPLLTVEQAMDAMRQAGEQLYVGHPR
jgi:uncharacterized protein with GYD domain